MKGILPASIETPKTIAMSSLYTGTGKMKPNIAAKQMHITFQEVILNMKP